MDVPFITRLPPELLVEITTFITDQSTIFRLATVCRHWHDVLTGTATLWTSIDCRSESRTSILLQRSQSSPIDIAVDRTHYVPEGIPLVASHIHRIRSIDVSSLSPRELEKNYSLLNGSAPYSKLCGCKHRIRWTPPDINTPFIARSSWANFLPSGFCVSRATPSISLDPYQ